MIDRVQENDLEREFSIHRSEHDYALAGGCPAGLGGCCRLPFLPLILSAATCTQQQLLCFLPGAAVGLWSLCLADAPGA